MGPRAPPVHTRNADLVKYRHKDGMLSRSPGSLGDRVLRFLLQLLLLALVKSARAVAVPFGRLFAAYFWMGRSVVSVSIFAERQLLRAIGWLSGTTFSRDDGRLGRMAHCYLGTDVKRWHLGLGALVLGGVVHGVVRAVRVALDERLRQRRWFRQRMTLSSTYEEWRTHAAQLEKLEQMDGEGDDKGVAEHEDYDRRLLLEKLKHLKRMRATGNPREMMLALRMDLIRNVANIAKSQKHRRNLMSIPKTIQQYIVEVKKHLDEIVDWNETELPLEEKVSFFKTTRHAFGRTALLLSGGGGLGTFHLGVCKALFERKMLPRVLAGSSVGSIVSAVMGTRTDSELRRTFETLDKFDVGFFQNSTALDLVLHAVNKGHLQNISFMVCKLRQLLGDCTFLEAFERTGRILNVTVCPADTNEPPRLLNYMTAPQALVWSAVAASSSFPGLYPPQFLLGRNSQGQHIKLHGHGGSDAMQRRWRDGSLEFDLPVQALGEMFNCNHFLVSQTNPHIVPLVNFKSIFSHKWASIMEAELKHRLQVMQWLLPEWRVTRYLTLFTQPWEGDVTFTLPSVLWNLRKTIVNPSTAELMRATRMGERATWERMSAIQCNCTIEAALDACSARLAARTKDTHAGGTITAGGRLPSWLHLPGPSVGMMPPSIHSWGDGIADHEAQGASWGDLASVQPPARPGRSPSTIHTRLAKSSTGGVTDARLNGAVAGADSAPAVNAQDPLLFNNGVIAQDRVVADSALAPATVTCGGVQRFAQPRLPPVPSSPTSDHERDGHDDAFDSASSSGVADGMVAAAQEGGAASLGPLAPAVLLRRDGGPTPAATPAQGSGGLSRRSSVMRNLHAMGGAQGPAVAHGGADANGVPDAHIVSHHSTRSSSVVSAGDVMTATAGAGSSRRSAEYSGGPGTPSLYPRAIPRPPSAPERANAVASVPAGASPGISTSKPALRSAGSIGPGADAPTAPLSASAPGNGRPVTPFGMAKASAPRTRTPPADTAPKPITDEQLMALAAMDTGGMIDDLWGSLLPLAGTSESLAGHSHPPGRGPRAGTSASSPAPEDSLDDGDGINIFAY